MMLYYSMFCYIILIVLYCIVLYYIIYIILCSCNLDLLNRL